MSLKLIEQYCATTRALNLALGSEREKEAEKLQDEQNQIWKALLASRPKDRNEGFAVMSFLLHIVERTRRSEDKIPDCKAKILSLAKVLL